MNLDDPLMTFVAECAELLERMEGELLAIGHAPVSEEAVNAIFRAAHTIKGSAGLFDLDAITEFTHSLENLLDRVRGGEVALDAALAAILLECADHIRGLVDLAASRTEPSTEHRAAGARLLADLAPYLDAAPATAAVAAPAAPREGDTAAERPWRLSLRFGRNVLRYGMDPLSLFRYLATFGQIVDLVTLVHELPEPEQMDAESSYLGYELLFLTSQGEAAILAAFEFVREDCTLRLLAPDAPTADQLGLAGELPESQRLRVEAMLREHGIADASTAAGPAVAAAPSHGQPAQAEAAPDQQDPAAPRDESARAGAPARLPKTQESQFIRVETGKLDVLIDLIGELVIAGAGIGLSARRLADAGLLESASTLATLVENLRDSALQLRMVQIGSTFNRFQRVVHSVARELGKDIELAVSGGETEIDKTMVERIADPLIHLVRNAIDHGIESAPARAAAGKPARGTVSLRASHDAGGILIQVSDDGGGLRRDRILARALERGLIDGAQALSDREVWNLIFEPGFSTAERISNLSGRGVGMDVVKRNVHELRGTVTVDSQEGLGTTVSIRLPLTLAIIDGFLAQVGESCFVVPLEMVEECMELTPEARGGKELPGFVDLRGSPLPLVSLRRILETGGMPGPRENLLVVSWNGERAGLLVDALLGEVQAVIKPLGSYFGSAKVIGGSTILGNGQVALILDIPGLLRYANSLDAAGTPAAARVDSDPHGLPSTLSEQRVF